MKFVNAFCSVKHDRMDAWLWERAPVDVARFLMAQRRKWQVMVARATDGLAKGRLAQGDTNGRHSWTMKWFHGDASQQWSAKKYVLEGASVSLERDGDGHVPHDSRGTSDD